MRFNPEKLVRATFLTKGRILTPEELEHFFWEHTGWPAFFRGPAHECLEMDVHRFLSPNYKDQYQLYEERLTTNPEGL